MQKALADRPNPKAINTKVLGGKGHRVESGLGA